MRRRLCVLALGLASFALVTACGGSDDGGGGGGSAGTASVASFDVGDAMCTASSGTVKVSWSTKDATGVELAIDGQPPGASAGFGPEGETLLDIPCSGGASTISITPFNDSGSGETVEKQVGGAPTSYG